MSHTPSPDPRRSRYGPSHDLEEPMNVVSWFEIPVIDMARARDFYTKVLGHTLSDLPSPIPGMELAAFPYEQNAVHASGALVNGEGRKPRADSVLVYFQCRDDLAEE